MAGQNLSNKKEFVIFKQVWLSACLSRRAKHLKLRVHYVGKLDRGQFFKQVFEPTETNSCLAKVVALAHFVSAYSQEYAQALIICLLKVSAYSQSFCLRAKFLPSHL
jgi:hypothetical protein